MARAPWGASEVRKEFLGRGWGFPLRFDPATGGVGMSQYEDNIQECITLILGTRPGERQMLPEFGCRIHELMFSPNTQTTATLVGYHVQKALARWEPRIEVTKVDAWPDDSGKVRVLVKYRVKSTSEAAELDLTLTAGG